MSKEKTTKRAYLQGEERRKVGKSVWLSEAEAERLEKIAREAGKSESQLARLALLQVLAKIEATSAVVLDDQIVEHDLCSSSH